MRSFVRRVLLNAVRDTDALGLYTAFALSGALLPGLASADRDACVSAHEQAQVERIAGHYLAARTGLLSCAQRDCPRLISDECNTWLGELDRTLPSLVLAVTDEQGRDLVDVRLFMNESTTAAPVDGRALALDPGVYKLRFEATGYLPVEQSLSIRDGEKNRLVRVTMAKALAPPHAEPSSSSSGAPSNPSSASNADNADNAPSVPTDPRAQRLWFASYALGTASVVSFAITLGAGARGFVMLQHCKHDGCSDRYADHGKSLYRAANVSAISGGVFLAAAASTLWSALRRAGPSAAEASDARGLSGYADKHGANLTAWSRW